MRSRVLASAQWLVISLALAGCGQGLESSNPESSTPNPGEVAGGGGGGSAPAVGGSDGGSPASGGTGGRSGTAGGPAAGAAGSSPEGGSPAEVGSEDPDQPTRTLRCSSLELTGPVGAQIYLDGRYTGLLVPTALNLAPGRHTVATGSDGGAYQWLGVEAAPESGACRESMTESDRMRPRSWRMLLVNVPRHRLADGDCEVSASDVELAAMGRHVRANLESVRKNAYGTIAWSVEEYTVPGQLQLTDGETALNINGADPPEAGASTYATELRERVTPGAFDVVAFVRKTWGKRANGAACNTRSGYWTGLGWWDGEHQTGTFNYRYDNQAEGRDDDFLRAVDEMVATANQNVAHEWLHTVERYYSGLPSCCTGWPVHNLDNYGFAGRENDWQTAFIRGTVPDEDSKAWLGISTEALQRCTMRDRVRSPQRCP